VRQKGNDTDGVCADPCRDADECGMNGLLRISVLVPLAGLIPLGSLILDPFRRLVPVTVRRFGEGIARGTGAGR
jgi:hypothetical protein